MGLVLKQSALSLHPHPTTNHCFMCTKETEAAALSRDPETQAMPSIFRVSGHLIVLCSGAADEPGCLQLRNLVLPATSSQGNVPGIIPEGHIRQQIGRVSLQKCHNSTHTQSTAGTRHRGLEFLLPFLDWVSSTEPERHAANTPSQTRRVPRIVGGWSRWSPGSLPTP